MSAKTLYLAWQDKREGSREWFPVAQLDADAEHPLYRFRYIGGAEKAKRKANFPLLLEFPDLKGDYSSPYLFPIFKNRVMSDRRPDFEEYLRSLDLDNPATPIEILSVSGGRRVTDPYEVFPKISASPDGGFTCRFFLNGWRHVSEAAIKRIESLRPNEELRATPDTTNPATGAAVRIQTADCHTIGWTPRYIARDLVGATGKSPKPNYSAKIVRVNPLPVPWNRRVLVEMRGRWDAGYEPMSGPDFAPLVE